MKVRCRKIINDNGEEVLKDSFLTIDKEYLVLEIYFRNNCTITYTILPDNSDTPVIQDSLQFEITDNRIPSNWRIYSKNGFLALAPEKWLDNTLWENSFWEDYHSLTSNKAERIFNEELQSMINEVG